jgi:hypothetical protein
LLTTCLPDINITSLFYISGMAYFIIWILKFCPLALTDEMSFPEIQGGVKYGISGKLASIMNLE